MKVVFIRDFWHVVISSTITANPTDVRFVALVYLSVLRMAARALVMACDRFMACLPRWRKPAWSNSRSKDSRQTKARHHPKESYRRNSETLPSCGIANLSLRFPAGLFAVLVASSTLRSGLWVLIRQKLALRYIMPVTINDVGISGGCDRNTTNILGDRSIPPVLSRKILSFNSNPANFLA